METIKDIKPGLYKHYRGNLYHVLGIGRHEESGQEMVIYQALYGDYELWIRPKEVFAQSVTINEQTVPRFTFIKPLFHQAPHRDQR